MCEALREEIAHLRREHAKLLDRVLMLTDPAVLAGLRQPAQRGLAVQTFYDEQGPGTEVNGHDVHYTLDRDGKPMVPVGSGQFAPLEEYIAVARALDLASAGKSPAEAHEERDDT